MIATGITFIATAVLLAVVARLTATGRIKRNAYGGIRTKASMADDESWLIVHKAAQPWMFASAAALLAAGVGAFIAGSNDAAIGIVSLVGALFCAVFAFAGTAAGRRAVARRDLPK